MMGWGLVTLSALFDSYAAYVVKGKFNELGRIDLSSWDTAGRYLLTFAKSPLLATAAVTFVLAPVLWFLALNRLDLSRAYPVLVGMHLVFVLILGVALLDEPMTLKKAIGTLLVLASLVFFRD
jgi:multidrug transporter EmrE-like cation transporter